MKELRQILKTVGRYRLGGERWALATVVETSGSFFRAPGARMVVDERQQTVGTMGGGCLEGNLLEHARQVRASGTSQLVTYDCTADDDVLWGSGRGCAGVARILLEALPRSGGVEFIEFLRSCMASRTSGVLATAYEWEGPHAAPMPQRLILREDGSIEDDFHDSEVREVVEREARQEWAHLDSRRVPVARPYSRLCHCPGGSVHLLIEPVQPPTRLVVFGAENHLAPLVRFAAELGWDVAVVDHRPSRARPERFPEASAVLLAAADETADKVELDWRSVVLVMTQDYLHDLALLRHLVGADLAYLGLLGPRERTGRLMSDLKREGVQPDKEAGHRVFNPAGLDIGAETAEEIGLSIIAEILAFLTGRQGGYLRNRGGPIHDRELNRCTS